jgi:hypothetical protein
MGRFMRLAIITVIRYNISARDKLITPHNSQTMAINPRAALLH